MAFALKKFMISQSMSTIASLSKYYSTRKMISYSWWTGPAQRSLITQDKELETDSIGDGEQIVLIK